MAESFEVLAVDDNPELSSLVAEFLPRHDDRLTVEAVTSPMAALDAVRAGGFDAVVSDYEMPEMDGLDLLDALRNDLGNDVPFIMFTGRGREAVAIDAINLGADGYIRKGGDPESQYGVLASRVVTEIERYRATRELEAANSQLAAQNQELEAYAEQLEATEERLRAEIEDRKATEAELRASEARFRKFFEEMRDSVMLVSHEDETYADILEVNPAAVEQSGYSREALLEMNVLDDLKVEGSGDMPESEVDERLADGESVSFVNKLRRADGTEIWVEALVTPMAYRGQDAGLSVNRDITVRTEQERALRRERDRLAAVAGLVSRDLHEPVAAAQDHLERVQTDCESEHIDELAAAVTRVEQLTEDLMSVVEDGVPPEDSDEPVEP